jgi:hypothetical protein
LAGQEIGGDGAGRLRRQAEGRRELKGGESGHPPEEAAPGIDGDAAIGVAQGKSGAQQQAEAGGDQNIRQQGEDDPFRAVFRLPFRDR